MKKLLALLAAVAVAFTLSLQAGDAKSGAKASCGACQAGKMSAKKEAGGCGAGKKEAGCCGAKQAAKSSSTEKGAVKLSKS